MQMRQLSQMIVHAALARNATLALAESCTGGRVAAEICGVEGASEVFLGGVVAYSNAVKRALLGVPPEVLDRFGAVSPETAHAMALGARGVMNAAYAVALTGIAGPAGATAAKPVGRVYIALATPDGARVERFQFTGTRHAVQTQATEAALRVLLAALTGHPERRDPA